jgi:hypothetical protein
MARRRSYRYNLPRTVADIVQAVCADYTRRENAIKYSAITGPTLARYVELNAAIDTALEGVEAGIREELLRDIASGRGYDASCIAAMMAKNTYYARKNKVVHDIARGLSLM